MWGIPLKKISLLLVTCMTVFALTARSQTKVSVLNHSSPTRSFSPVLFPHNWIRGYMDFSVAPPHNEPDLGRCMFPQPASAGGAASTCTAYARYLLSGYLELRPIGRTPARHLFLFLEPRMAFGKNLPQVKYTASMEPISYDQAVGIGFQLPRNFELRATQHQVYYLGRYGSSLGPADLHTSGPYGLYATVGVRWSFGGYGHQDDPSAY